jgi:hypothetical protein
VKDWVLKLSPRPPTTTTRERRAESAVQAPILPPASADEELYELPPIAGNPQLERLSSVPPAVVLAGKVEIYVMCENIGAGNFGSCYRCIRRLQPWETAMRAMDQQGCESIANPAFVDASAPAQNVGVASAMHHTVSEVDIYELEERKVDDSNIQQQAVNGDAFAGKVLKELDEEMLVELCDEGEQR